jgi:hypothetical protein
MYRVNIFPNPAAAFFDDETLEQFAIYAQGRVNPFKL